MINLDDFVPEWAKRAVWYQIVPERFWNGDPENDPTLASLKNSWPHDLSEPWQIHPWTSDWYMLQPYERTHGKDIWHHIQRRRYGGDVQGILDRLDYLQDLGVTALYLTPVFEAPSLHKYDGATYHHVDPHFGPDPAGDRRLIASETPDDPRTWVWTKADLLIRELIDEVHRREMRLIFDGVFNHMSLNSWAFQDVIRNGRASRFSHWFKILDWDTPSQLNDAPFTYSGWRTVRELPELNQDENGIVAGPKDYIFQITRRWMDPDGDGDPRDGIDGWRLDVAYCVKHPFWKDWRRHVKAINPEAYLVAEIILEESYESSLQGDEFDAVMNYEWAFRCAEFFVEERDRITASTFDRELRRLREAYPAYGMMNVLDSHDTARIASHIVNRRQLRFHEWHEYSELSRVESNPAFDTRRPTVDERAIQKLMILFQMTYAGAPLVYYGDEAGMWGAKDPCCRKPMVWPELEYEPEATLPDGSPRPVPEPVVFDHDLHDFYKTLIRLRNNSPALQLGKFTTLFTDDTTGVYAFERCHADERVVVVINNGDTAQRVVLQVDGDWVDRLNGEREHPAGAEGLVVDVPARWGALLTRCQVSKLSHEIGREESA